MIPETWNRLLAGYGFCDRHAWIHISVEMSFRDRYLLGPAILYEALIAKALRSVRNTRRLSLYSVARRLRATNACFLCAQNVKDASAGASSQARLQRGRDHGPLREFASDLEPLWSCHVCSACRRHEKDSAALNPCRLHLLTDVRLRHSVDLLTLERYLEELHDRVACYLSSFTAGGSSVGDQDRAAFIAAVGWCSGWRPLLALLSAEVSALS
jgi:hypothetical protein